jgi:hypothetical protein
MHKTLPSNSAQQRLSTSAKEGTHNMANIPSQSVFSFSSDPVAKSSNSSGAVQDTRILALPIPRARFSGTISFTLIEDERKQEMITPPIGWDKKSQSFKERFIKREMLVGLEFDPAIKCNVGGKASTLPGLIVHAPAHVFTSRGISIETATVSTRKAGDDAKASAKGAAKAAAKGADNAPMLRRTRAAGAKHVASSTSTLSPAAAAVADVPLKSSEDIAADIAAQKAARLNSSQS